MDEVLKRRLAFANSLLFETPGGLRFTQDSPILPNVWLAFATRPHDQHELILTCAEEGGTGQAAQEIRQMLNTLREKDPTTETGKLTRKEPRVSYIPGQIAVRLYFDELMRVVLPLTQWWHETYDRLRVLQHTRPENAQVADWKPFPQPDDKGQRQQDLLEALMFMRRELNGRSRASIEDHEREAELRRREAERNASVSGRDARLEYIRDIPADLCWLVRIAGLTASCFLYGHDLLDENDVVGKVFEAEFLRRQRGFGDPDRIVNSREKRELESGSDLPYETALQARREVVRAFMELYRNWSKKESEANDTYPSEKYIWRVTRNRPIHLAVSKSALTVKADAAIRLFNISCDRITWAVVDSGIDPRHDAFKLHSKAYEKEVRAKLKQEYDEAIAAGEDPGREPDELRLEDLTKTRIVKTLDFTRLRELLDFDIKLFENGQTAKDRHNEVILEIARRMKGDSQEDRLSKAMELLKELRRRIDNGKDINWQDLEDAIVDNNPDVPENDHGTHVAGILGADWIEDHDYEWKEALDKRDRKMKGVCPDINLIDVRVFRDDGLTDEFELLAALQYLRWMNSRAGTMQVHGANLSLSLIHEVRRFACGRTPICDECDEAAAAGMVIVAAAGNRGFEMRDFEEIRSSDSYRSVSITDPGNANGVITVGATHRKRPHEYGVSYFSSRGPTGDGRLKPDIVAPGEKILGPTPQNRAEYKDGTSMAAPHVSGAAAMLMARHTELIAQPEKIKRILCETATDLGRERYFQGHGLVDILRALQSV
ncbi:S8 family peptidase [Roseibium sp. M-1]